jgi:two-component system sensor histidine kinase TctE
MTPSVSRRLLLWLAVPLTLLALAGGLASYFITVAPLLHNSEVRLTGAARALTARLVVVEGEMALRPAPAHQPEGLEDGSIRFAIRDAQARLVAGDEHLAALRNAGVQAAVHSNVQIDHRSYRAMTVQVGGAAGPATVTVAEMLTTSEPALRFAYVTKRPLKTVRAGWGSPSPTDLRPLPESAVPKEILPVSTTLNRLLGTVRTSLQTQQQFVANTAHQLRTPIAGLSAQLELLAQDPAAAPVKERLASLGEGMRQLAHTTNQLLMLARADSAAQRLQPRNELVELRQFATDVVARFVDRAVLAHIDLGLNAQAVRLRVDPALLDDLLVNLVDNALKYTPPGGVVTVGTGIEGSQPYIEVDDTGCGIPEPERQRVRQRFYRSPGSPSHGTGLGLAIVEEIARVYGATFSINDGSAGRGTRVRLLFPAALLVL